MRKWLLVGFALLAFSGVTAAISLTLAIIASETPMSHDQYLRTIHSAHATWYAAFGTQLIGAWVTWLGFSIPRSKNSRLLRCAAIVAGCDIGSFLITLVLVDSRRALGLFLGVVKQ
jgi:hypothetical protein